LLCHVLCKINELHILPWLHDLELRAGLSVLHTKFCNIEDIIGREMLSRKWILQNVHAKWHGSSIVNINVTQPTTCAAGSWSMLWHQFAWPFCMIGWYLRHHYLKYVQTIPELMCLIRIEIGYQEFDSRNQVWFWLTGGPGDSWLTNILAIVGKLEETQGRWFHGMVMEHIWLMPCFREGKQKAKW